MKELGSAPVGFLDEIAASHSAIAAILAARGTPPSDLYQRSEQALVAGHRYHPAPKSRGTLPAAAWLPYAPETHAEFRLSVLTGDFVDAGEVDLPPGTLPAHPLQLSLLGLPAGADGPPVWPTSSVRTVYDPAADLFYKFSLDIQITNDVRRLWTYDLHWIPPLADVLKPVFADIAATHPGTAFLLDHGYRTSPAHFEGLAVVVRDGIRRHTRPGVTPLLAAGLAEGFPGNPLDALTDPAAWFRAYVAAVVPPVLHAFFAHGVVMESHMQNVLVGVDATGVPVQAFYRDHEGMRLLPSHSALLSAVDGDVLGARGVSEAKGWERLQYCLIVNHLVEIAGAVHARHPGADLWSEARAVFAACADAHGSPPQLVSLLESPVVPAKANLLLRWTRAEGAASRYVDCPNPLRSTSVPS
ncbi:IucA/IucC family C-terminal-domain containing protein [Lentzea chajnantorensis]